MKFNRSYLLSSYASFLCIDEYLKCIALRGDIAISNEIYRNGFRTSLWTQLNRKRIKYMWYHYTWEFVECLRKSFCVLSYDFYNFNVEKMIKMIKEYWAEQFDFVVWLKNIKTISSYDIHLCILVIKIISRCPVMKQFECFYLFLQVDTIG